jgi:predicted DCC family thiol-disulfide oxidoreductase YuxK
MDHAGSLAFASLTTLKNMMGPMTEQERIAITGHALLLYDGVCALCNGVVHFLMNHDKLDRFRYAPLQSELGREVLSRFDIHSFPDGVVLLTDALTDSEQIYHRSDAVGAALKLLGGSWKIPGRIVAITPPPLRDWGYGLIARFRYRLFGRYDTCPVPTPEQRDRMLGVYE